MVPNAKAILEPQLRGGWKIRHPPEHGERVGSASVLLDLEPLHLPLVHPQLAHLLVTAVDTVTMAITFARPLHTSFPEIAQDASLTVAGNLRQGDEGVSVAPFFISAVVTVPGAIADGRNVDASSTELTHELASATDLPRAAQ